MPESKECKVRTIFFWWAFIATYGCIPPYASCLRRNFVQTFPLILLLISTHWSSCLTTTFDKILRSEFTTATHVSSAEDSNARTVNFRDRRVSIALDWLVFRLSWVNRRRIANIDRRGSRKLPSASMEVDPEYRFQRPLANLSKHTQPAFYG